MLRNLSGGWKINSQEIVLTFGGIILLVNRLPNTLWKIATRKLDQLDSVIILDELKVPPGNHLEKLSGNRNGQYSIRINQQYRICFMWTDSGPDKVEIIDYH